MEKDSRFGPGKNLNRPREGSDDGGAVFPSPLRSSPPLATANLAAPGFLIVPGGLGKVSVIPEREDCKGPVSREKPASCTFHVPSL